MNFPECGQYLSAIGFVVGFLLGGLITFGAPFLFVELQQFFEGGRWRDLYTEEKFGAEVYSGAKTEVPLVLRLQAVDILQFVLEWTGLIQ